ncbi:MAG: hypothetical protein ACSW8G_05805 [Bacillota bacterium]
MTDYYPKKQIIDLRTGVGDRMNDFKDAIKREQRRIQGLIDLTDQFDHFEKRGALIADRRKSGIYCYEKRDNSKKYLGRSDSEAARDCLKYHYLAEKRKRLLLDRSLLENLVQQYLGYDSESVFAALPDSYRSIAVEDFNDERYEELKQWANADYVKNQAPFPDSVILAVDGTRVRSKGECLHYNILYGLGIPFRYDSVITITDGRGNTKNVSPDFMIQNYDHSLTIIEHLGRLFDMRYALDFGEKCYWYLQEGFILGKNFFVTSDDICGGTDTQAIMEVAKAVERRFYGD